jgi:hypothetical protein
MSRTHAISMADRARLPFPGSIASQLPGAALAATAGDARPEPDYTDRAILLWPRLSRARLRRVAADPERIAELVCRRTSQPYTSVVAMLTREPSAPAPAVDVDTGFESGRQAATRASLQLVATSPRNPAPRRVLLPA